MKEKETYNVVLVYRTGGDFKFFDVLLLAYHIRMNSAYAINIYCLTDIVNTPKQIENITLLPMGDRAWSGWWSKFNLFSPELERLRPFLYLDLDTVVCCDLRGFVPQTYISTFLTLEDFYRPKQLATGAMFVPVNNTKVNLIWEAWVSGFEKHMKTYRGDQEFIRTIVQQDHFLQDVTSGIYSFKPKSGKLLTLPKDANLVCFHGKPRPVEAAARVKWVADYYRKGFEYEG